MKPNRESAMHVAPNNRYIVQLRQYCVVLGISAVGLGVCTSGAMWCVASIEWRLYDTIVIVPCICLLLLLGVVCLGYLWLCFAWLNVSALMVEDDCLVICRRLGKPRHVRFGDIAYIVQDGWGFRHDGLGAGNAEIQVGYCGGRIQIPFFVFDRQRLSRTLQANHLKAVTDNLTGLPIRELRGPGLRIDGMGFAYRRAPLFGVTSPEISVPWIDIDMAHLIGTMEWSNQMSIHMRSRAESVDVVTDKCANIHILWFVLSYRGLVAGGRVAITKNVTRVGHDGDADGDSRHGCGGPWRDAGGGPQGR